MRPKSESRFYPADIVQNSCLRVILITRICSKGSLLQTTPFKKCGSPNI
ncbi:MAG: hypothetical protein LBC53_04560 [Spirochaetaceae bacterium]|nr:hypothetical protein [Spirochaetaceae bacterium]